MKKEEKNEKTYEEKVALAYEMGFPFVPPKKEK